MARGPRKAANQRGVVLDSGAFIALERRRGHVTRLLASLVRAGVPLVTSAGVVAEIWRGGDRAQAPIAMLLPQVEIVALDATEGKLVGMLLGLSGGKDPVDAHVVLVARERGWPVLTADEGDLRRMDPSLEIVVA